MRPALHAATWALRLVSTAAVFGSLGAFVGPIGAVVGILIGLVIGGLHAWAIVSTDCYSDSTARAWFLLLVDNTWAITNTTIGAVFLAINFANGNRLDTDRCTKRSSLVLREGVIKGFATTVGMVEAGTTDGLDDHELVHVLQARIFGPFFYVLVALSYVICTLFPYWLLYHDHEHRPIRNVRDYFLLGVYPHTWHEEWAYRH